MSNPRSLLVLLAMCIIAFYTHRANAYIFRVAPDASSSDAPDGVSSLVDALDKAVAGDTIELHDGTYTDRIRSTRPGNDLNPITIISSRQAVINAPNPRVEIKHSWVQLEASIYMP